MRNVQSRLEVTAPLRQLRLDASGLVGDGSRAPLRRLIRTLRCPRTLGVSLSQLHEWVPTRGARNARAPGVHRPSAGAGARLAFCLGSDVGTEHLVHHGTVDFVVHPPLTGWFGTTSYRRWSPRASKCALGGTRRNSHHVRRSKSPAEEVE